MMELVGSIAAAVYAALSAFVVTVQVLAPLLPWQASVALSGVAAAIAALAGWSFARMFRGGK